MSSITPPELRFMLSDTRAKAVITDSHCIGTVREAAADLDHVRWFAILDGPDDFSGTIPEYGLEALLDTPQGKRHPGDRRRHLALLLYTSGTTGKPKAAMLTHDNLYRMAVSNSEYEELETWDQIPITVNSLPLAHIFGVGRMNMGFLIPEHLKHGYTVLMTRFDAETFMQLVQKHRANKIWVVPTMLSMILNHRKRDAYDLTSLVDVTCGSAPLPAEQAREFCRVADIESIRAIYGCTECGSITAVRLSEPHPEGTVGRVAVDTEMAIVDDDGPSRSRGRGKGRLS